MSQHSKITPPQSHSRIAVVGAGPAGLTLATMLHRNGHRVRVFEADVSVDTRDQGGTLDLHRDSGQLALKKAGLLDAFLAEARLEDQEQRVADYSTGVLLREEIPEEGTDERPEIDRIVLRRILLKPLPDETVCWGTRVEEVIPRLDSRHDLRLKKETVGPFDLVIGADGAWSQVRRALTDVRPVYSGVTFVELWLSNVDNRHPALAKLVGHGTLFSIHDGAGIFAQRNGNATIRVYAAFLTRPEDTDRPDRHFASITKPQLLARFNGWAPSLLALIAEADQIAAVRPIVALPDGFCWKKKPGLTLVGDAAHVMPPLGTGVNLAMLDAADLAESLITNQDWHKAVCDYESMMMERASPIMIDCNRTFAEWFESGGVRHILDNLNTPGGKERTDS